MSSTPPSPDSLDTPDIPDVPDTPDVSCESESESAKPIPVVLLPSLDGTGDLFEPLLRCLPVEFAPQVIRYPVDQPMDYAALVQWVAPQLPRSGPYLLVGEAFSGPVAVELARQVDNPPTGLVLCCSFASSPRPGLLRCLDWLPSLPPLHTLAAPWVLQQMVFGRWPRSELIAAMSQALGRLTTEVLHTRLLAVHRVDIREALATCEVPIQYWQASEDRLVPAHAFEEILEAAPAVHLLRFEGPHALLQARPERAAEALVTFACELGLASTDAPAVEVRVVAPLLSSAAAAVSASASETPGTSEAEAPEQASTQAQTPAPASTQAPAPAQASTSTSVPIPAAAAPSPSSPSPSPSVEGVLN